MTEAAEGVFEPRPDSERDVVIIGADGSPASDYAFQWYMDHLHKKGNHVVLVHAHEAPSMPTRDSWDSQNQAGNSKRDGLQEKYAQKFKDLGILGKFIADHEKPGVLICDTAKQEGATYVIVGTRGLGKVRRTILGSVSDYCVHHCLCPVVVCRPAEKSS